MADIVSQQIENAMNTIVKLTVKWQLKERVEAFDPRIRKYLEKTGIYPQNWLAI